MTQVDMADSHGLDHSRLTTLVGYAASRAAIELRFTFGDFSPNSLKTGSWEEAAARRDRARRPL